MLCHAESQLEELSDILHDSHLLANYLALFQEVKKDKVTKAIMAEVTANYEKIGVRVINTLIHQYFIHGGLKKDVAKKSTFQKTLSLNS